MQHEEHHNRPTLTLDVPFAPAQPSAEQRKGPLVITQEEFDNIARDGSWEGEPL